MKIGSTAAIVDLDSAEVEITNPLTGAGVNAFVTLAGPENERRKAWEFGRQRKVRADIQRTGKLAVTDPEEDELDQIEVLLQCVLDWRGFAEDDVKQADGTVVPGAPIPFSKEAARQLFQNKDYAWLRGQLMGRLRDRDLFIKVSAPG